MVAAFLAIGFAAWHRDSFAIACTVMAAGWALCDVFAWRDYRDMKDDADFAESIRASYQRAVAAAECPSSIKHCTPDGTIIKHTHWCGCEI